MLIKIMSSIDVLGDSGVHRLRLFLKSRRLEIWALTFFQTSRTLAMN